MVNSHRGSAVLAPRYQPHRTQAMPKRTLFGSNIETVTNKASLDELLANVDQDKASIRRKYSPVLPDYLQTNVPGREKVIVAKNEYQKTKAAASKSKNDLVTAHEDLLFLNKPSNSRLNHTDNKRKIRGKEPLWFTKDDLENEKAVNCLGLNSHESYNHHKYGKKPEAQRQYRLMGDILQPQMNGAMRSSPTVSDACNNRNNSNDKTDVSAAHMCRCHAPIVSCKNEQCLTCGRPKMDLSVLTKNLDKDYEALSNISRSNTFPGYTLHHYKTTSHSVHSDEVYLKRDAPTDQFRAIKDAYSVWAEANLVREKMKRVWKESETVKKQN